MDTGKGFVCSNCDEFIEAIRTGSTKQGTKIWKTSDNLRVTGSVCPKCKNHRQKKKRQKTDNLATKTYEKTPRGYLMRAYRNMKSRIQGVQKKKVHLYSGKVLMPKEEFYLWASKNQVFRDLFAIYKASGFDQKFAPSVDRIDPSIGYEIGNIEFVTHSENSSRGAQSKWNSNKS